MVIIAREFIAVSAWLLRHGIVISKLVGKIETISQMMIILTPTFRHFRAEYRADLGY